MMITFWDFDTRNVDVPQSGDFPITLGNITVQNGTDSLQMTAPIGNPSGDAVKGLLKLLPGGNFSVIVRVQGYHVADEMGHGILFRDTSGQYLCVGNVHTGSSNVSSGIMQHSTANTGGFTSFATGLRIHTKSNLPTWHKATFNASTNDVEGFYSYTGDTWVSHGTSTFLGTADAFGIGVGQNVFSSDIDQQVWFSHFEVQ